MISVCDGRPTKLEQQKSRGHQSRNRKADVQKTILSYNPTVGSNPVQVAAQQHHQRRLCFLHIYEWGSHYTAVGRHHEDKKPGDKRLGVSSSKTTTPSAPPLVRSCTKRKGAKMQTTSGTSRRQHKTVFTLWGSAFYPEYPRRLRCLGRPPTTEKRSKGENVAIIPTTFPNPWDYSTGGGS